MAEKENKKEEVKKEEKETKKVQKEKKDPKKVEKVKKVDNTEEKKKENKEVKEEKKKNTQKVVDTKKFEVKKEKPLNKKSKNKIMSYITILVIIAIVAVLTVLIITSSDPKKSVDGMLTNLKNGDFEKAQEFMIGDDFLEDQQYSDETQKLLFDKISWKVKKVTIQKNSATVELEVTNKNFSVIVENCMKKMLSNLKSMLEGNVSESAIEKYFIEELKNEDVQTTTETNNIQLEKQDKKWKVVSNQELINALLPGLEDAVNSLN